MDLQTLVNPFFNYVCKKSASVAISNWNINLSVVGVQQQSCWKNTLELKAAIYPYDLAIY